MSEQAFDDQVIRELADGRPRTGQQLAERLSVSQGMISQCLRSLTDVGLHVQAMKGKRYRLGQAIELLSEARIHQLLEPGVLARLASFELYLRTDSSNERLLERSPPAPGRSRVCLAEYQTSGRGRMGRQWQAPFASGLCLSIAHVFEKPDATFSALGLAAGVAVVEALAQFGLPGVGLKWPNDVIWQGRKLGGVLIETRGEANGQVRVVIGVGLNYALDGESRRAIAESAVLLPVDILEAHTSKPAGRNVLAAVLVNCLFAMLAKYERLGLAPFLDSWRKVDMLVDRLVVIDAGSAQVAGIARGIDRSGALLVEVDSVQQRFVSGEASLVKTGL